MIIHRKSSGLKLNLDPILSSYINPRKLVIIALIVLVSSGAGFVIGRHGFRPTIQNAIIEVKLLLSSTYYRLFSPSADHIDIDIAFDDWQRIVAKRDEALAKSILITSDDDFVSGEIRYRGESIPVKLRLKGDWTDHIQGNKWSFRIHTKDNRDFRGLRRFSIQDPQTRRNLNEWIFLQAVKKEGLIGLRYDFVDVSINGEHKGIYAVEEHFSKELLENNQRREAPILKFSEDQFWINRTLYGFDPGVDQGAYYKSPIEVFRQKSVFADPNSKYQFGQAQMLLREYREGSRSFQEVFDTEKWAKFFALADIFGVRHGLVWHGLRFYYNPITGLLEPIPFDAEAGNLIKHLTSDLNPDEYQVLKMFEDDVLKEKYANWLDKYSQEQYLIDFLSRIDADLKRLERILLQDQILNFSVSPFFANQSFVRKKLSHSPAIRAERSQDGKVAVLNLHELPVQITGFVNQTSGERTVLEEPVLLAAASRFQPRSALLLPLPWEVEQDFDIEKIGVLCKFLGLEQSQEISVSESWFTSQSLSFEPSTYLPDFVVFDIQTQTYRLLPGRWSLNQTLVLPKPYGMTVPGGTTVDLTDGSAIIIHGSLVSAGSEAEPVRFISSDGTGQGVLVIQADGISSISYTSFSGLSAIDRPGYSITGAITFYQSPVDINHALFENIDSEDMLNIIESEFEISQSSFVGAKFDALDIDFGKGSIIDTAFKESGNDAIDLSGSLVSISLVQISEVGDKGISAGESSQIEAEAVDISSSYAALAVKDLSRVSILHSKIRDSKIGIAAYQKKEEYGPGFISLSQVNISQTDEPFLVEKKSTVYVDNQKLADDKEAVFNQYFSSL